MSWLFGMGKSEPPPNFANLGLPPPPNTGGDGNDGKSSQGQSKMEAYRFDSGALERAAKAAKELEKSGK